MEGSTASVAFILCCEVRAAVCSGGVIPWQGRRPKAMKAQRISGEEKNILSAGEDLWQGMVVGTDLTDCKSTNLSDEGVQADEAFHSAWGRV
jgi:hypothetical protein